MSAIDWGSVPTWFSAIGTTGALSTTIGIIVRDRRKDAREDAGRVVVWFERPSADDADYEVDQTLIGLIHARNTADRPVFDLRVVIFPDDDRLFMGSNLLTRVLAQGEEEVFPVPFRTAGIDTKPPAEPVAVEFQDVDGVRWLRDLETSTLHRLRPRRRRVRTYLRRQWLFVRNFGWKAFDRRFRRHVAPKGPSWRR
ncbi:hypothetical protein [Streptomyces chartreusis]|uniref:Uncharacterized protein n=1 Tax=Streptomyces chartreusis TaxID=1969 RepID=A0A7H8TA48_STRCX|nr:hypothetical protein [Streptomyces chartreusis]QKZ20297.1 hypothetical protein HUT05_24865 [Streptomyces chartreusis]